VVARAEKAVATPNQTGKMSGEFLPKVGGEGTMGGMKKKAKLGKEIQIVRALAKWTTRREGEWYRRRLCGEGRGVKDP